LRLTSEAMKTPPGSAFARRASPPIRLGFIEATSKDWGGAGDCGGSAPNPVNMASRRKRTEPEILMLIETDGRDEGLTVDHPIDISLNDSFNGIFSGFHAARFKPDQGA